MENRSKQFFEVRDNFTQIPNVLIQCKVLSPSAKCVLMAIACHGAKAFPKYKRIEAMTGFASNTISKAIKELEAHQIIRYKRGSLAKRLANLYEARPKSDWILSGGICEAAACRRSATDEQVVQHQSVESNNTNNKIIHKSTAATKVEENSSTRISVPDPRSLLDSSVVDVPQEGKTNPTACVTAVMVDEKKRADFVAGVEKSLLIIRNHDWSDDYCIKIMAETLDDLTAFLGFVVHPDELDSIFKHYPAVEGLGRNYRLRYMEVSKS